MSPIGDMTLVVLLSDTKRLKSLPQVIYLNPTHNAIYKK
ncbi:hypothetical protein MNB_SUP05-SYMBIONT-7-104 [hydrothermal vent metagenome]|uniref:Uncharacterized protein n=1 Tax=hydrothermal vent metagenome TaxID=652676 RepID=A0A1W1E589_9ZZZZ